MRQSFPLFALPDAAKRTTKDTPRNHFFHGSFQIGKGHFLCPRALSREFVIIGDCVKRPGNISLQYIYTRYRVILSVRVLPCRIMTTIRSPHASKAQTFSLFSSATPHKRFIFEAETCIFAGKDHKYTCNSCSFATKKERRSVMLRHFSFFQHSHLPLMEGIKGRFPFLAVSCIMASSFPTQPHHIPPLGKAPQTL